MCGFNNGSRYFDSFILGFKDLIRGCEKVRGIIDNVIILRIIQIKVLCKFISKI